MWELLASSRYVQKVKDLEEVQSHQQCDDAVVSSCAAQQGGPGFSSHCINRLFCLYIHVAVSFKTILKMQI